MICFREFVQHGEVDPVEISGQNILPLPLQWVFEFKGLFEYCFTFGLNCERTSVEPDRTPLAFEAI